MEIIENIKTFAEMITAISTALIVVKSLIEKLPKKIKIFFTKTIPDFFTGTTDEKGKKVRFFKGLKLLKEYHETQQRIISVVKEDYKTK